MVGYPLFLSSQLAFCFSDLLRAKGWGGLVLWEVQPTTFACVVIFLSCVRGAIMLWIYRQFKLWSGLRNTHHEYLPTFFQPMPKHTAHHHQSAHQGVCKPGPKMLAPLRIRLEVGPCYQPHNHNANAKRILTSDAQNRDQLNGKRPIPR